MARAISVNVAPSLEAAITFMMDRARRSDWTLPVFSVVRLRNASPFAGALGIGIPRRSFWAGAPIALAAGAPRDRSQCAGLAASRR